MYHQPNTGMQTLRTDITGYLHQQPRPAFPLYRAVRMKLGLTQRAFAKLLNIGIHAVLYRERVKRVYHLYELAELQRITKLSDKAFMQLLRDSA